MLVLFSGAAHLAEVHAALRPDFEGAGTSRHRRFLPSDLAYSAGFRPGSGSSALGKGTSSTPTTTSLKTMILRGSPDLDSANGR
jgi:hypothetical protein